MKINEAERPLLAGILLCLLILLIVFSGEKKSLPPWPTVELPDISRQPLKVKVAHAINSRFPSLTQQQLNAVLVRSQQLVKQHFNLDVAFEFSEAISIDELFQYLPAHVKKARRKSIIDLQNLSDADVNNMWFSIYSSLKPFEHDPQSVIDYAKPYLSNPKPVHDLSELTDSLVETLIVRGRYWHDYLAQDGQPVVDNSEFNQWVWWDSLGYGKLPFELVLTNQLVVSAEAYGMATHSSLRGGITAGTTSYSRNSPYSAYVYVSTFQITDNSAMMLELRGGETYSDSQLVEYTAALVTHELGHLFFHYAHPFNRSACVMNPTPLLKYSQWVEGFDVEACKALGLPAMRPGASELDYNPLW